MIQKAHFHGFMMTCTLNERTNQPHNRCCDQQIYVSQDATEPARRLMTHLTNYCEGNKNRQFRLFLLQNLTSMRTPSHFILDCLLVSCREPPLTPCSISILGPWAGSQLLDHCRDPIIYLHHHVIPAHDTFFPSSSSFSALVLNIIGGACIDLSKLV